jgi:hypothetical protein
MLLVMLFLLAAGYSLELPGGGGVAFAGCALR